MVKITKLTSSLIVYKKHRLVGSIIEFHIPQKRHTTKQIQSQYQAYLKKRANTLFPKLTQKLAKKLM